MTSGTERWKDEETALDRVWSVGVTLSRPRSARWIAQEAEVSERTARRHLTRLVETEVLEEVSGGSSMMYRVDPRYVRLRAMRGLLQEHGDLEELRSNLQGQIDTWREQFGVGSAESIRKMAGQTDTAERTRQLRWIANEWETILYRLGLVEEAIELRASGMI